MTLKIRFSLLGILFALLLLFAWACEDSQNTLTPSNGPVALTWFTPPQNLEATQVTTLPVIAEVTGLDAYDVDSVKVVITDASGGEMAQFRLYDDANAFEYFDALEFCSAYSGDVVAHDGKFTRQINGQFAPATGDYDFTLHAWWDNSTKEVDPVTITIAESVPPLLSDLFFPISLASGFDPIQINLKAIDPDTIFGDSVTDVFMKFYTPLGVELDSFSLGNVGGDLYGTTLTPDINIGLTTDTYIFAFWAKDAFNNLSDSLGIQVDVENQAPFLDPPQFDHTVALPDTYMFVPITVPAWDDQTLADVDSVNMLSYKPDGTYANSGLPIPLNDDGEFGDLIAGDSLFTINAVLYDSSLTGPYIFTFWARDLAGNTTEFIIDTLIVTEP